MSYHLRKSSQTIAHFVDFFSLSTSSFLILINFHKKNEKRRRNCNNFQWLNTLSLLATTRIIGRWCLVVCFHVICKQIFPYQTTETEYYFKFIIFLCLCRKSLRKWEERRGWKTLAVFGLLSVSAKPSALVWWLLYLSSRKWHSALLSPE